MEFRYYGANCIRIDVNKSSFVVDPSDNSHIPQKEVADSHIIVTGSYPITAENSQDKLVLDYPGEYEVDGVAIKGIQIHSHLDVHESDVASNTLYTFRTLEMNLCIFGNATAKLDADTLERIGTIDILVLPVGGGMTLSPAEANSVVKQIDPKICIATHFDDKKTAYETPQASVRDFFEEIGSGEVLEEKKYKVKSKDISEEGLHVVALPL